MNIKQGYDEVLSDPKYIKESWELKELLDNVWEEVELSND